MKSFKKNIWGLAMIVGLLFLAACGSSEETTSNKEEKINVVTTIAQIGEPLSVIGGEHVNVESLMGPSVDPHLYNPTQSDISKVDSADLIFYNGLNLEVNMVDVFDSIGTEKPVLAIGDTLSEEQLLEDEEGAVDPHIWFDIDLWESALNAAVEELKEYAPEHADEFEANKQAYFEELDSLRESAEKLEEIPEEQRVLVTAHDAFGYFGNQHDMEVVGLQGLSTEGEIGVSDINETIGLIEEYKVPAIFVESSVNQDSINAVIEGASSNDVDVQLGGELFSDAMGEKGTDEGTYIGMYQHNIDTIHEALTRGDD
ncbi:MULTISPECIES: zinc ABC transporter substrate-binding protein [Oceanobacillus]|uniref:Manganese transporter n=1 Tax=Oceanobacillus kimchii TaxID=746691 RepID=A0ABQ5TDD4_9BACI|nr:MULTISPECIES: zinc ABC transporter substrate-binding protein [Oceanobacillus]MBT2652978.1 zinc ABC transporter substrate-binding protein [Oceanobacillus sp. ISL-73]OEH53711.1 manganese transporter [Oceanobacillus sp. E9]GLO64703.1 manganese transporter [Oceanobacillus kimchii]